MSKILFITTTNLSTNPRLLKELKLASKNGHTCTFIGFKLGNWSDKTEQGHLRNLPGIKPIYLSATKEPFFTWVISTIVWKLSVFFNKYYKSSLKPCAYAHNKRTWQLVKANKKLKESFDLVIAHNLGALYPAYKFAEKLETAFAFDIEDYHPGEKCSPLEKKRRELLMKKILPKAAYITYASPLIGENSFKLLEKIKQKQERILVNNSFAQSEFRFEESKSEKLQLAWFSQNIAAGRGLELIIPALSKFKNTVRLNLIGNLYPEFKESFLKPYLDFIRFAPPLPQKELNLYLCQFDVGLAIELSTVDFNRDICLTNKIFAYIQSGLFVLATDTSAQKQFIEEHKEGIVNLYFGSAQSPAEAMTERSRSLSLAEMTGLLTAQTTQEMEKAIEKIINNIETIRTNKKKRFEYAKRMAWEVEKEKLVEIWSDLLIEKKSVSL